MENKKVNVFSEESLEKMSAPEQFTDYLRIVNPSAWVIVFALILLFLSVVIWSSAGRFETAENVIAVVSNGNADIIVDNKKNQVRTGMILRIDSEEYRISSVSGNEQGRIVASSPVNIQDGVYDAVIITESVAPIDFLFE